MNRICVMRQTANDINSYLNLFAPLFYVYREIVLNNNKTSLLRNTIFEVTKDPLTFEYILQLQIQLECFFAAYSREV